MISYRSSSKSVPVLIAVTLVVVLAGTLGARLVARGDADRGPEPPQAVVPPPTPLIVADLAVPCWSCPSSEEWPVRFRTDLDLLAPLGNGGGNAAVWFAAFEKERGPRFAEANAAMKRLIEGPGWLGDVLPPDDPLLLEAEPWCDQAEMTFYPEIFPLEGYSTRITNLLLPLRMVRSWVARGLQAEDTDVAMADFRRAIRLGRLLRQEDVVVISDLVGLACIHLGARGIYERAIADGDLEQALLASVVVGEVAAQRCATKQRLTATDVIDSMRFDDHDELELDLTEKMLEAVIQSAKSAPDRRFRLEAILGLNFASRLGSPEQRERASEVLVELTEDADPKVADAARWSRDNPIDNEQLKEWVAE